MSRSTSAVEKEEGPTHKALGHFCLRQVFGLSEGLSRCGALRLG